jgi:urease accessory protein
MKRIAFALLIAATAATPAFAHLNPAEHGSFAAGFSHPLFGADHILAMVAVGLWAALLATGKAGSRALWLVPAAFVGTMLTGFAAALGGFSLPFVEPVIASSVVVIGLLAEVALQVPVVAAMAMVGFFAFFHGFAHGGELGEAGAVSFCLGFGFATAILHAIGLGLGVAFTRTAGGAIGRLATRVAGAATALAGLWLIAGA